MKPFFSLALALLGTSILLADRKAQDFNVILTPAWHNLDEDQETTKEFGGKWILAGSITFKKKAKDTVHLNRIYLHWDGPNIEQLRASLYKAEADKQFLPLQENLICDGAWNQAQQVLMLNFEKRETLGLTNIFNLVLTVPETLEPTLKTGGFTLITNHLPEPFQIATRNHPLSFSFSKQPHTFKQPITVAKR